MNFSYDKNIDTGYIKFTDNKIVKSEPIAKNLYVDLDKNNKPVGVEVLGKKNMDSIEKQIEQSLANLEAGKFKEFAIDEYLIDLKKRFGEGLDY